MIIICIVLTTIAVSLDARPEQVEHKTTQPSATTERPQNGHNEQSAEVSLDKALEALQRNRTSDVAAILDKYHPSNNLELSKYHAIYARMLVAQKRLFASIEHYRIAYMYATAPAEREALLIERADAYAAMKYYSEAAICYELFLRQFPKSSNAARAELGIAETRAKLGEFRAALMHYERAGTDTRVQLGKANALQALGRTKEAADLYRILLEKDKKAVYASPEALCSIAENYRIVGNLADARQYFGFVKDITLRYRVALGQGMINLEEKRYDIAIKQFTTALDSSDKTLRREATLRRAEAQMQIGKLDIARDTLEELRRNYPYGKQYEIAVLLLGKIYHVQGKLPEAVTLLKPLIYRRTPVVAALDEIESIILEVKDKDKEMLLTLWNEAGRWLLDNSRIKTIMSVAKALRQTGKPFLNITAWILKYGSDESKTEVRFMLAEFYATLGNLAKANDYLEQNKAAKPNDEINRLLIQIAEASHDQKKVVDLLLSLREVREEDLSLMMDMIEQGEKRPKLLEAVHHGLRKAEVSAVILARFADMQYRVGARQSALEYYRLAAVEKKPKNEPNTPSEKNVAAAEWARYRIATMTHGEQRADMLKQLSKTNDAIGRFATAELKGAELRRKVE